MHVKVMVSKIVIVNNLFKQKRKKKLPVQKNVEKISKYEARI